MLSFEDYACSSLLISPFSAFHTKFTVSYYEVVWLTSHALFSCLKIAKLRIVSGSRVNFESSRPHF